MHMDSESVHDHLTRLLQGDITVEAEETRRCDVVGCDSTEVETDIFGHVI